MKAPDKIRVLVFTTLYPNAAAPSHGIFVEQRLRKLLETGRVEARVVAPIPWFPFSGGIFGRYAKFARAPAREQRFGIDITHPRYPLIPRFGMTLAPAMLAAAAIGHIRGLMAEGWDFDLIDAHYYYPDGVAAALLARWLGKPFVVTARGTDINLVPRYPLARAMIRWAARRAAASITVCQALKDEMEALHVDGDKITVLRNGVDLLRFAPIPQSQARARLRVSGKVALCVGHLIERKGHHLAIEAMRDLPDWQLLLVGGGEMETQLRQLATRLGVQERVRFEGSVAQDSLCDYYSAADALILASSREGMANVLLEALACGTPVVATRVWGTPEVIAAPEAGELIESRDAAAIVQALKRLSQRHIRREDTRRYAEGFNWDATSQGLLELLSRVTLSGRLA